MRQLNVGKVPGLDKLTAAHVIHSHPALFSILVKLFNIMLSCGSVPTSFGRSYTVPVPNFRQALSTVHDLRGISISSVLSNILENYTLDRFSSYLTASDNEFGCKKNLSFSHAIYSVRSVINSFISGGSTVSVCAIDLSKAFHKMNHHVLFNKLMLRLVPSAIIELLETWFASSIICAKGIRVLNSWGTSGWCFVAQHVRYLYR